MQGVEIDRSSELRARARKQNDVLTTNQIKLVGIVCSAGGAIRKMTIEQLRDTWSYQQISPACFGATGFSS